MPLPAAVSGQGYRARHQVARTTAPLGSSIIRRHGLSPRLVDTVLHILGRYPLGGLRAARRYRLHGAASCLRRHAANHAAGPPSAAVAHFRRHDALRGDRCAADRHAIHRPHDPEQDLWTGHHRDLYYIYGYADLEHKEVWISLTLLIGLMILITSFEYTDNYVMNTIVHLIGFPLAGLLLWRVETLSDLSADSLTPSPAQSDACLSKHPDVPPCETKNPTPKGEASHIARLLAKHCEGAGLYLQTDLTMSQLSAAVGVNRYYLSQYFTSQGISYYEYIHDLRIRYFIARCRELAAAQKPIVAQQLALESGYRSYSTFSTAFKQRMHKSVTAWMREELSV